MNETIEKLLLEKAFDTLDDAERLLVLEEMSAEQYERLRAVLMAAPTLDDQLRTPPRIRKQVLQVHRARFGGPIYRRPISLSAAAAVALLTLVAGWYLGSGKPPEYVVQEKIVEKTVTVHDTLWRTRVEVRTRWRERPAASLWRIPVAQKVAPGDTASRFASVGVAPPDTAFWNSGQVPWPGSPIGAAPELWMFLGNK